MADMKLADVRELMLANKTVDKDTVICGNKVVTMDQVKAVEEKDGILTCEFVLSNSNIDRDFDTVNVNGWDLTNFRKNPVVLWSHDHYSLPVAKSLNEYVENGQLIGKAQFAPKELNDFSYMVGQMYKHGFLNAVSCGFRATEWKYVSDENRPWGIDFLKQELWEYSCCTVPSNPDALLKAKQAGIDVDAALKMAENVLDSSGVMQILSQDDAEKIYAALRGRKTIVDLKNTDEKAAQRELRMRMQLQINQNLEV